MTERPHVAPIDPKAALRAALAIPMVVPRDADARAEMFAGRARAIEGLIAACGVRPPKVTVRRLGRSVMAVVGDDQTSLEEWLDSRGL